MLERKLLDLPRTGYGQFIKATRKPHEVFHVGPPPKQYRRLLVYRCFLVSRREHKAAQATSTEGGALCLVPINSIIAGDDDPMRVILAEHGDPFFVGRVATAGKVRNVAGAVTGVRD